MRCHQARQRLIASGGKALPDDRELREHLDQCPGCAVFARAEQTLRRDLATARADDNEGGLPLSVLKTRVEARAGLAAPDESKETTLMGAVTKQLRKRPRLGLSVGILAVLLAVAALVPFTVEDTIGYEIALAGVDPHLALDSDKLTTLLEALNLGDAEIDVGDCEATCKIRISDLKTEDDVQMVIAAFDELGNCILEEVTPVCGEARITLIGHAAHVVLAEGHLGDVGGDLHAKVHEIVLRTVTELTSDSTGEFTVWVNDADGEADGEGEYDIQVLAGDSTFDFVGTNAAVLAAFHGEEGMRIAVESSDDGTAVATITLADGETHVIDLSDDDAEERLRQLGLDFQHLTAGSQLGDHHVFICETKITQGSDEDSNSDSDAMGKQAEGELPEGYTLAQNYPNPFNPSTRISFTMPEAQHVSLEVFNIQGQRVRTLVDEVMGAGEHTVEWDGCDSGGDRAASGTYFYRLTAGEVTQSKKMILLK